MLTTFDDIVSYVDVKVIKNADYNFFYLHLSQEKLNYVFIVKYCDISNITLHSNSGNWCQLGLERALTVVNFSYPLERQLLVLCYQFYNCVSSHF